MSVLVELPRTRRMAGGTLLGLVIGLVVGLAIAAAVAMVVTRATVPFVNKTPRAVNPVELDPAKLPDPNRALYSKEAQRDALPSASSPVGIVPPSTDVAVIAPPPPNVAPGADGKAPVIEQSAPDSRITLLQAGAFSNADDAESMRGRLALLGFDSRVAPGERDGARFFRVRLGPYGRIEDLNRARQRLIENGVEVTLVAPGK